MRPLSPEPCYPLPLPPSSRTPPASSFAESEDALDAAAAAASVVDVTFGVRDGVVRTPSGVLCVDGSILEGGGQVGYIAVTCVCA